MTEDRNAETFTAVFREIYNDILIESYDPKYASLEGIGMRAAALKADRILPAVRAARIKRLFSCYRGMDSANNYIENYGRKGRWSVRAYLSYPTVTLAGRRLGHAPFSENGTPKDGCAVVCLSGGRPELSYISEGAEKIAVLFGGWEKFLSMLPPPDRLAAEREMILTKKTRRNSILTAKLSYFVNGGVPFVHISLSLDNGVVGALENSTLVAMAVTDGDCSGLRAVNPKMGELISSGRLTESRLLSSYPFRSAFSQGFARCGIEKGGNIIFAAVPEWNAKGMERIILFAVECDIAQILDDSAFDLLTPGESKVVRLAAAGKSGKSIGARLNISEGTVKRELFTSCKKLGVSSRIELITTLYHLG